MTQHDKDAALGRAVRAKAEAIRRLAELRSHAKMLGVRFSNLGSLLVTEAGGHGPGGQVGSSTE